MKRFISVLLCIVLVLSMTACSNTDDKESNKASSNKTDSDNKSGSNDDSNNGDKKTIYVILKLIENNQYWAVVRAGAEKAGQDLGCNVVVVGTDVESNIDGQLQLLQDAVDAKADGIVIGPLDRTTLTDPIAEQFNAGMPMVLIDSIVDGDAYSCALLTNNEQAGKMAAEEMIKKLKESGVPEDQSSTIAIQVGSTSSQAIEDRLRGFNAYWIENAPEAWKVLNTDIKVNDGDVELAATYCKEFIDTYPDLVGVFGPNNGSTVGFVNGLNETGRKDIVMIGFDFSTQIEEMIRGGEFTVSAVVQKQYMMGYDGVKNALELANGGSGGSGIIDTGVLLVDSNNVDSDDVQNVINPK